MAWVAGKVPGSKTHLFEPFSFDPFPELGSSGGITLREFLIKLVHEQVRDFHLREQDRQALKVITSQDLVKGWSQGKFLSPREDAQKVDPDDAVGAALQAFEDGLYLVFIDDEPKKNLDEEVFVNPSTQVTLIRLVALAGA